MLLLHFLYWSLQAGFDEMTYLIPVGYLPDACDVNWLVRPSSRSEEKQITLGIHDG